MELKALLLETHAHMPPPSILEGLSVEAAEATPEGAPHSIAEIVAHLAFWQDWFCATCRGSSPLMPSRAAEGWPAVAAGTWPDVLGRFSDGLEDAVRVAEGVATEDRPLGAAEELLQRYTVRDALVHVAQHNAHHLGQVVLLRQLLRCWPPPAGSFTW